MKNYIVKRTFLTIAILIAACFVLYAIFGEYFAVNRLYSDSFIDKSVVTYSGRPMGKDVPITEEETKIVKEWAKSIGKMKKFDTIGNPSGFVFDDGKTVVCMLLVQQSKGEVIVGGEGKLYIAYSDNADLTNKVAEIMSKY